MRDNKFRGLTFDGEWVYGLITIISVKHKNMPPIGTYMSDTNGAPYAHRIHPETVGQYIGELSETGCEMYEGDIVQKPAWLSSDDPCNGLYPDEGIIEFKYAAFMIESDDDFYDNMGALFSWDELNVIGNIHS